MNKSQIRSTFSLIYTKTFNTQLKRLLSRDLELKLKLQPILEILLDNPFSDKLLTYKICESGLNEIFATRLTKNVKILWQIDRGEFVYLLAITGIDNAR